MTSLVEKLTLPFDEDVGEYDLLSDRVLGSFDIAAVNLACGSGLPGSHKINMEADLDLLDRMAAHVDSEVKRNYHHFLREPGKYNNSQAQWCVLMMITVVQQDFDVRYNPKRIRDPDFKNSGDLFIHGMFPGRGGDGGTCASIPVLYTAIGRRLGWPIYLTTTRGHVFCRWDDPAGTRPFGAERFNIEGSTLMGGHIYPDEFYLTWPEPLPPGSVEAGIYLRTLTPREVWAMFLANRGHCQFDNGRLIEARESYAWAYRLAPHDPHFESFFIQAHREIQSQYEERVLREYYGNDIRLPFGAHPPHVLRKMQSDMLLAMVKLGPLAHMPASARRAHEVQEENRRRMLERERKMWEQINYRGLMHVPPYLRRPHEPGYCPLPGYPDERPQHAMAVHAGVPAPGMPTQSQVGGAIPAMPAVAHHHQFGRAPEPGLLLNEGAGVMSARLLESDASPQAIGELRRRREFAANFVRHAPPPKAITAPPRINLIPPNKSMLRKLRKQMQRMK